MVGGPIDDREGAVSTEYLFLVVLIAIAIVVGAFAYGTTLGEAFESGGQSVTDEVNG